MIKRSMHMNYLGSKTLETERLVLKAGTTKEQKRL